MLQPRPLVVHAARLSVDDICLPRTALNFHFGSRRHARLNLIQFERRKKIHVRARPLEYRRRSLTLGIKRHEQRAVLVGQNLTLLSNVGRQTHGMHVFDLLLELLHHQFVLPIQLRGFIPIDQKFPRLPTVCQRKNNDLLPIFESGFHVVPKKSVRRRRRAHHHHREHQRQ